MSTVVGLGQLVAAGHDAVVDVRRSLHAAPELSFEEHETAALLRERLRSLGLTEEDAPLETAVVAVLDGGRPGRTVLLRADIDALPVEEVTDLPFRSRRPGVMHACGHDAHAAILTGVAAVLAERAESLPGRYCLVFQPAEEALGGARALVEGGLLEWLRPDAAVGLHVAAPLPSGLVGYRSGVAMSAADAFRIDLRGRGGHVAMSGDDGNALAAAAMLTTQLRTTVEDLVFEDVPCVCAAGVLHAGTRLNVVPAQARIEGTLRTFTGDQHIAAMERLEALLATTASRYDVDASLTITASTPAVVNDAAATALVAAAVSAELGAANVFEVPPFTPSDDMSELLRRVPGCYFFVGCRPGTGVPPMHHAPDFAIDEAALGAGVLALAAAAVALAEP